MKIKLIYWSANTKGQTEAQWPNVDPINLLPASHGSQAPDVDRKRGLPCRNSTFLLLGNGRNKGILCFSSSLLNNRPQKKKKRSSDEKVRYHTCLVLYRRINHINKCYLNKEKPMNQYLLSPGRSLSFLLNVKTADIGKWIWRQRNAHSRCMTGEKQNCACVRGWKET